MSTCDGLIFKPVEPDDGTLMLTKPILADCVEDHQDLFPVALEMARNIVAGSPVISFEHGDPTPGEPVIPVELVVTWSPKQGYAPYCLYPSAGFPHDIARVDSDTMMVLRDAGALPRYPEDDKPKFFLACDPSHRKMGSGSPNRWVLPGMAGYNIRGALDELRHYNQGSLKGPYHLQDAAEEPIEVGMPAHDRRNWEVTDYAGRCEHCGHMFLGPKRAPACRPCATTIEARAVAPKTLTERLALRGDAVSQEAVAEITRLKAEVLSLQPTLELVVNNATLRDMIDADSDDTEVEAGSPASANAATVWHDIASAPVYGFEDPEAQSYVVIAEYGDDTEQRIAVEGWFEGDRFMTDHETPLNDLWIPRLWSPIPRGLAGLLGQETFQARVQPWMTACFGEKISRNRRERNHRFLEEALELVQSLGCSRSECHQLVDYVYGRPEGEVNQEIGGVMVTLAALCLAAGEDMHAAAEKELARVWTKVEKIRAKQAAKPQYSPLPEPSGVYMASKAVAHGPRWQALRDAGFPVISTWIDESQPDATLDWPDLWQRCLSEVARAEVLICYMEPGETLKGVWVEVGAALALGVPVLGVGIGDFSIAKSGKIALCNTLDEAVQTAHGIMDGNAHLRDRHAVQGNW